MRRLHRLETVLCPTWLAVPLLVLGAIFLISGPALLEWPVFAFVFALAVATGLFTHWRYRSTVVERSEDAVLVRFQRRG